jgi:hypothetical protein
LRDYGGSFISILMRMIKECLMVEVLMGVFETFSVEFRMNFKKMDKEVIPKESKLTRKRFKMIQNA